jgi:hypothetical protein
MRTYAEAITEFRAQPVTPSRTLSELRAGFRLALSTQELRSDERRPLGWLIERLRYADETSRWSLRKRVWTRLRQTQAQIKQRVWPVSN